MQLHRKTILVALAFSVSVFAGAAMFTGWWPVSLEQDSVVLWVENAGFWGPAAIIGLMILAVVASPIPSAPIALAAGAAYGHYAATVYLAIGAELGAIIAFAIARTFGREPVRRLLGKHADHGLLGSQNALTLTVFASRLLPFISFDAMSYAAGLSALHGWRFTGRDVHRASPIPEAETHPV